VRVLVLGVLLLLASISMLATCYIVLLVLVLVLELVLELVFLVLVLLASLVLC
jgi:hypothetical protein